MRFIFYLLSFSLFFSSYVLADVYEEESSEVNLYVGSYVCYSGTGFAHVFNQSSYTNITIVNSSYSAGNCSLTSPWCCPTYSSCSSVTNKCVYNATNPVDDCSDLLTESSCNSAPSSFAISLLTKLNSSLATSCGTQVQFIDPETGSIGSNATICGCYWNSSLNKCSVKVSFNWSVGIVDGGDVCSWVETSRNDECSANAGKITITYSVSGSAVGVQDYCVDYTQEFPCDVSVKLPFFDKLTFIISALFIAIGYFVLNRKM